MDSPSRKRLFVFGWAAVAVGLVVGFIPTSKGPVSCGSAFNPSDEPLSRDFASTLSGSLGITDYIGDCADALQMWRLVAIVVLLIGIALLAVDLIEGRSAFKAAERVKQSDQGGAGLGVNDG